MANEAVLEYELELPIPMTCSNTVGIEKGAILMLSDPFTVATSTGTNDVVAGIAAAEKIASDGKTKIPVFRRGIFKVMASGTVTVGDPLGTSLESTNKVYDIRVVVNLSGTRTLGTALESATDGETFYMELHPMPSVLINN